MQQWIKIINNVGILQKKWMMNMMVDELLITGMALNDILIFNWQVVKSSLGITWIFADHLEMAFLVLPK